MTLLDSFWISLGWKIDPKGLEGFAALTQRAKTGMIGFGASVSGAFYGLDKFFHGAATRLGGIKEFSDQMGIGTRTVAALGKVADENGSSLEGMESALRGMTIMAGQAEKHLGRGAKVFERFGLKVKDSNGHVKTTEQLLGDVADKLAKTSSLPERNLLGGRLGFDPAMIALLSKGRANLEALRKEAEAAIPFGEKDYEAGLQAERGFKKATAAVTLLRDRIAVQLFPAVNQMLAQFVAWTKDPEKIRTITRYMKDVVEVAKWVAQHFGTILKVAASITALKAGMWFFHLGKDALEAALSVAKLVQGFGLLRATLMGGILGLIILIAQDLWVFHEHGKSVTGWMLQKFPDAVRTMEDYLAVLGAAFLALSFKSGPIGLMALAIYEIVQAGKDLKENWSAIQDWWDDLWDDIGNAAAKVINPLVKSLHFLGLAKDVETVAVGNVNRDWRYKQRKMDDLFSGAQAKRAAEAAAKAGEKTAPISWLGHANDPQHKFLRAGAYWGKQGGNSHIENHVGAIHVHVKGGEKWTPKDALNHAHEIKRALASEGLMSPDQNRINTHNAQPAHGL